MASRISSQNDLGFPSRRKTSVIEAPSRAGISKIPAPSSIGGGKTGKTSYTKTGRTSNSSIGGMSRISSVGVQRTSLQSNSSRSSRSSIYGHVSSGIKKDPRPLSDKGYQQMCIKRLRTFLLDENYPREVKPKCLQSMSTKEFIFILNFILERIDPMLVISGLKIDEELPFVIKLLKYPFVISKNHMVSVGSPHSWPIMLGLIMWLLDSIQTDMTSQLLFPKQNDFDESDFDENNVRLSNELYRVFLLKGYDSDEYKELLSIKQSVHKNLYEQCEEALQSEVECGEILKNELATLQQSSISTYEQHLQELHTTRENILDHVANNLKPTIVNTIDQTLDTQTNTVTIENDIDNIKHKITESLEQIKEQPMSAKEATDLRQRIKDRQDTRLTLKQRVEEARHGVFDLQRRHGNIIAQVDRECKEVNDCLRRMSAIIPDGQYIPILDYNTSKRADPLVLQQLSTQAKNIKETVHQLNVRTAQELAELDTKIINVESGLSMLQTELLTKKIDVENNEHDLAREKRGLEQLKKKREEDMKTLLSSKMTLENEIASYHDSLECNKLEQLLETTNKKYNEENERIVSEIARKTQTLQELCVLVCAFLEKHKTKQQSTHQEYLKLLAIFKEIKPPVVHRKFLNPP